MREKDTNCLIAIAHPKRGKAISYNEIQKLTGYDCIEAFNHLSTSIKHWDLALSAGNPMFLLSDDDTHNHHKIFQTGRLGTAVYVAENDLNERNVIQALKNGQSYAIEFHTEGNETFEMHKNRVLHLPYLKNARIVNDTFIVVLSDTIEYLEFIGQEGALLKRIEGGNVANYPLQTNDTYVRVKLKFKESQHIFFLNPIFRYNGKEVTKRMASENMVYSILYKIVLGSLILFLTAKLLGFNYLQIRKRK